MSAATVDYAIPQTEPSIPAPGRLRRWLTWRTFFIVLLVVNVAPVWLVTHLPTQDGPAHLYNSRIFFAHLDRANWQINQFYDFGYQLYPNLLTHLMLGALQQVMPALIAEKVVVSLIVTLMPLSLLYLLNSIERGRAVMCLIGLTFAYHNLLNIGFYNFSLSVPLCLLAFGFWWRHKDDMTLPRLGGFYALALLTYLAHFAGFMALVLSLCIAAGWSLCLRGIKVLLRARRGEFRSDARRLLVWAVGMGAILLPLLAAGWDYNFRDYDPERVGYHTAEQLDEVFWQNLTLKSYGDWSGLLIPTRSATGEPWFAWTDVLLWLTAGLAGMTVLYRVARLRLLEERDSLILIVALLCYLYFTLPWGRNAGGWVNDRLLILAWMLAYAWFGRFHRVLNVVVAIPLIVIALIHTGKLARDYWVLQPELHELTAATHKIKPHSTVEWDLRGDFRAEAFPDGTALVAPWLHALSYYGLSRDVALFSNYEAQFPYFPTHWGEAPRRDADYVVCFGYDAPRTRHGYESIHESPHLTLLERRRVPPDLSAWRTLPDGRRALSLRFTGRESGDAAVRVVGREQLFESGSFGWVRMVPRMQWRSAAAGRSFVVCDTRDRPFRVDLPNGRYQVTLLFPPHPLGRYQTCVIANDVRVGDVVVEKSDDEQVLRYTVDVTDAHLLQLFYTTWRGSPDKQQLRYWGVGGMEIEQLAGDR